MASDGAGHYLSPSDRSLTGTALIVPIRIDVLPVSSTTQTTGPLADFSTLPFHDGRRDVNPGRPFLTPLVGDTPFEEDAVRLPIGVHLHWSLPDPLTRGRHRPDGDTPDTDHTVLGLDFPRVPNRWLVQAPDGWWVVESDYVHPEGSPGPAVTYLLTPAERVRLGGNAPFRRVGRQVRLEDWRPSDPAATYLDGITATGWGHPLFHAHHPSCSSVFGFHHATPEKDVTAAAAYRFRVFGWYATLRHDPITALAAAHPGVDLTDLVKDGFGWQVPEGRDSPDRLLCAGYWSADAAEPATAGGLDRVVLGATGTEALAALLADDHHAAVATLLPKKRAAESRALYEEVVESIVLGSQLDPERPDAVAALRDARHDKEFVAVPSGHGWTIRARGPGGAADAAAAPSAVAGGAPAAAVARIDRLDGLQRHRDRLDRQGTVLRERLFADWCAYLECKYPPRGSRLERPDVDELRRHIEVHSLAALEANAAEAAAVTRDLATEAAGVLADLAAADAAACEIGASDVRDWTKLADGFGSLPPALRLDPDDAAARAAALDVLREMVRGTRPLGPLHTARVDELPPWLGGEDLPAAAAIDRAAATLLPDDAAAATAWRAAALLHVAAVRSAQRNRALLEQELRGSITVATKARHELDLRPGPRFWRPRDPVLLLSGPAVGRRRSSGAPRPCALAPLGNDPAGAIVTATDTETDDPHPDPSLLSFQLVIALLLALQNRPGRNWHPIMLDWKVAFHDEATPAPDEGHYRPDHLRSRYALWADDPDMTPRQVGDLTGPRRVSLVTGRSLLTPHPAQVLRKALDREAQKTAAQKTAAQQAAVPMSTFADKVREDAVTALKEDDGPKVLHLQTASLSGLHDALLMREPALPIGVDDPLGFPEAREFAARVAAAVGPHAVASPRPLLPFMPLRTGRLQLVDLRLIDGFGRFRDGLLTAAEMTSSEAMPPALLKAGRTSVTVYATPPRLIPPARLQMRWLAAGASGAEAHDHPSTGPICGWLLPNLLDQVLTVHGADGAAIGSVDLPGRWRPAPGWDRIVPPEDIDDPGLRRVAVHLLHGSADERSRLMKVLKTGMAGIEPDAHAQQAIGLLIGRPVAVVRASMRLEMLGHPPVDHGWPALRDALAGHPRSDGGLREVRFPVRLGEHRRVDDGLLGFWPESGDGFDGAMRAPHGVEEEDDDGKHDDEGDGLLVVTPDAPATTLTMLVDPRAAVHATTGVLPTKVLRIPPEQYGPALRGLGVTFRTAPVLTDPDVVRVALPVEPGYAWSWLERTSAGWQEESAPQAPRTDSALTAQQLRDGWLRLTPQDVP